MFARFCCLASKPTSRTQIPSIPAPRLLLLSRPPQHSSLLLGVDTCFTQAPLTTLSLTSSTCNMSCSVIVCASHMSSAWQRWVCILERIREALACLGLLVSPFTTSLGNRWRWKAMVPLVAVEAVACRQSRLRKSVLRTPSGVVHRLFLRHGKHVERHILQPGCAPDHNVVDFRNGKVGNLRDKPSGVGNICLPETPRRLGVCGRHRGSSCGPTSR